MIILTNQGFCGNLFILLIAELPGYFQYEITNIPPKFNLQSRTAWPAARILSAHAPHRFPAADAGEGADATQYPAQLFGRRREFTRQVFLGFRSIYDNIPREEAPKASSATLDVLPGTWR